MFSAYADMIDKAIAECGENVFADNRIPMNLIAEFEKNLFSIDPDITLKTSFWLEELHRLRHG